MANKDAILVYGAGVSGLGAAEVLAKAGNKVILYNDEEKEIDQELYELLEANEGMFCYGDVPNLLATVKTFVISPGISIRSPLAEKAKAEGIEVISEVELAFRNYHGHIAAITGTNGKTTTTTLIGKMFEALPVKTAVGGNIGLALSKEVEGLNEESFLAAELSSYQLEGVKNFKADIAVVLNLTPDHLERHHTMEEYGVIKKRILNNQTKSDYTILNYDDKTIRSWGEAVTGTLCYFSRVEELYEGVYLQDGTFYIKWQGDKFEVCHKDELKIFGSHNEENVLAAIACGFFAGVSIEDMKRALVNFTGVEHRLEYVTSIDDVPYYNDSKATNPESTIKALESFPDGHIVLIAGGRDKGTDLTEMMNLVKKNVDLLILIGEAKERFEAAAKEAGVENIVIVKTFSQAIARAKVSAMYPQVVLLSPACASFDMFKDFPARGKAFKEMVLALAES